MRVAIVGGTGGFGLALAKRLAEAGYDVVVGSRDPERAATAAATVGVQGATNADAVVVAPSNPYTSIHPILAVGAIRDEVAARRTRTVAVSPLVGGRAVKGPLDRMLTRMGGGTSPAHVTQCYEGLIGALVVDRADAPAYAEVPLVVTDTLMTDRDAARRLAETVLEAVA